jgi:hypothetical protein
MERGLVNPNPKKRRLMVSEEEDARVRKLRRFKILLPNETVVELTVPNEENKLPFGHFIGLVRDKYLEVRKKCESMRKKRDINWKSNSLYLEDRSDNKIRNFIDLNNFMPYKCHILRLNVSIKMLLILLFLFVLFDFCFFTLILSLIFVFIVVFLHNQDGITNVVETFEVRISIVSLPLVICNFFWF